ncbi:BnaA08g31030D [Brassica napus]|uniref:BnaA08g31030D protein n=1 Tax=Brassica napus TaxID=3708 RepID=A0A078JF50_BRANA|nr:BnaA08g31030D [Brassica napus]
MSKSVEWSGLPEELVDEIAGRLFSKVELHRVRSICKPWRSASSIHKRYPKRHDRNRVRVLSPLSNINSCLLSPAAFFRVFLSSCRNKGWLIKTQDVSETRKKLLHPLSRVPMDSSQQTLDLLEYTVTEIHQSYDVTKSISYNFARVVLMDKFVFGVNDKKEIWCNNVWTRVSDEEAEYFSDIIVHKGQIYALDLNSAIWWISLSELKIFQYGPSTPMDYYEFDDCKDKRLVEFCGELCIIHRFCKTFRVRRVNVERTIGFKVYKMDMELVEWVEVKSLGDNAFVMATDSCFSVVASDYYGCLEDAIYFTEKKDVNNVSVFKLGQGCVTKLVESFENCFHMFYPPFV